MTDDEFNPKTVNVSFHYIQGLTAATLDSDEATFNGLLDGKCPDGVVSTGLHLLNGLFHLLLNEEVIWKEIAKDKHYTKLTPVSGKAPSANSHGQVNFQPVVDAALYILQCIARERDENLTDDQLKDRVRGLVGYSLYSVKAWGTIDLTAVRLASGLKNLEKQVKKSKEKKKPAKKGKAKKKPAAKKPAAKKPAAKKPAAKKPAAKKPAAKKPAAKKGKKK